MRASARRSTTPGGLIAAARAVATSGQEAGASRPCSKEQTAAWAARWHGCDIEIGGDARAQQGIRFCIFMLLQTYTGVDTRLNIGPKGFTGEKYGGVTYWDTEAYCLPFYLATAGRAVARELLVYRYNQLDKAIENAAKLGLPRRCGALPDGHRQRRGVPQRVGDHLRGDPPQRRRRLRDFQLGIRYTGDTAYLADCGLEVLLSVARFWAQRITWSGARRKYVMLGVTGPNEYENNVDNNWYTSYIACWSMRYAAESAAWVREKPACGLRAHLREATFRRDGRDGEAVAQKSPTACTSARTANWVSSSSRTAIWTREQTLAKDLTLRIAPSTSAGRGTASCARA